MSPVEIDFIDAAFDDLHQLSPDIAVRALKKIMGLELEPLRGDPLGSTPQGNLTGYWKLTVGNRDWRIIYRPSPSGDRVTIWHVGLRGDSACYREARRRIEAHGEDPKIRPIKEIVDMLGSMLGEQPPAPAKKRTRRRPWGQRG